MHIFCEQYLQKTESDGNRVVVKLKYPHIKQKLCRNALAIFNALPSTVYICINVSTCNFFESQDGNDRTYILGDVIEIILFDCIFQPMIFL